MAGRDLYLELILDLLLSLLDLLCDERAKDVGLDLELIQLLRCQSLLLKNARQTIRKSV